ncbi:PfkB family carbohydrate kinase [soil metagenome]
MPNPEIIIIGGANTDIKAKSAGALARGSSMPGSVVLSAGGVARNIAHNLAQLGVRTALISAVGKDTLGDALMTETEAAGVDVSLTLCTDGASGSYIAILDSHGEMQLAVNAMESMAELLPAYLAKHEKKLKKAKFLVADCNLPEESLAWLARFADKLIVEPVSIAKAVRLRALDGTGLFAVTPNRKQAEALTAITIATPEDARRAAMRLHARGIAHVVISLGRDGALASREGVDALHVPPIPPQAGAILDVTGAGDAAAAGVVFGLLRGESLHGAAHLGQAAAAITMASPATVSAELTKKRLFAVAGLRPEKRT